MNRIIVIACSIGAIWGCACVRADTAFASRSSSMTCPARSEAAILSNAASSPSDTGKSPDSAGKTSPERAWMERIKLIGTLEGESRWLLHRDITLKNSGRSSDLYLRTAELGIETDFLKWASGIMVLNSEWIGDYLNAGDEKLTVDEVHVDLSNDSVRFYITFGKRTQPFGVFENHLVSDPMTQDAYETKKVGLTVGWTGPADLDLSVTLYKGDELLSHLFQAGLFDSAAIQRYPYQPENVESFIASVSSSPVKDYLTAFGALSSEPGSNRRNYTLDGGFNLIMPFHKNLAVDIEFIKALARERYVGCDREFKEGVVSVGLAYSFEFHKNPITSRGLYRARRQYTRTHPMELAARYEYFDDDSMAEKLRTWSVKDRYLGGGRYTLYQEGTVVIYLGLEYRGVHYRLSPLQKDAMVRFNHEGRLRLGLDF